MINLSEIYKELKKDGQGEGGLHLESFLTMIRSKLESIHPIPEGQGDVKDQEFSKKEIASLLNFFIYLANDTNALELLTSPGPEDANKTIILGLFADDSGENQLDMALNKITSRIDQLLEFSREKGIISKELFDEITKNINIYAPKTSEEEVPDQNAESSLSDINLDTESPASQSDDKHKNIDDYREEYNKILTQEEEFAKELNEKEQNNLSPEKYSGIGASVEMILNENKEITGFRVLSVVENSHAQDLKLKEDDTLLLKTPVGINEINATVNKIRNLDFCDLYINKGDNKEDLKILDKPSPRRQFFSTNVNEDKITMISADKAGINKDKTVQVDRKLDFSNTTPTSSPKGADVTSSPRDNGVRPRYS